MRPGHQENESCVECKDVDSQLILEMFPVSFVYSSSVHVLCLLKYLDLSVFRPVSISMLLFPLLCATCGMAPSF